MYRVLIVEDDPMVAMINEQYVRRCEGFEVAAVCVGSEALALLESERADLMILDVYMPGISGIELLKQLRERRVPIDVIMVTAANDRETLEEALRLGAVDYLVKPFAFDRFKTALEKFRAHAGALENSGVFDQAGIDRLMADRRSPESPSRPKGIQEQTLRLLLDCLKNAPERYMTGDDIAACSGLSGVTVRRYMNYLAERGSVTAEMDYHTGGRPCMKYILTDEKM